MKEEIINIEEVQNSTPPDLQDEIRITEERLATLKSQAAAQREPSPFAIPLAIVLAGAFIGAGIYFGNTGKGFSSAGTASVNTATGSATQGQTPALGTQPSAPQGPVNVFADDDPFLGKADAPVVVIEFSDFQCPFCRRFWTDTLPQLKTQYIETGQVKFVYRDFPLPFHEGAKPAAEGSECAEDQGKFWELHDAIFAEQNKQGSGTIQFTKDDVKKWAAGIGLNMVEFTQCLDSGKYTAEVDKDYNDGQTAGVSGTPTVFINGRIVVGAQPFSSFATVIDEELKKLGK